MPVEGEIKNNRLTGQTAVFQGGQWVLQKQLPMEASMRSRTDMGLAPMVEANQKMVGMERQENPLNRDWGATILDSIGVKMGSNEIYPLRPVAKKVGGQDFQDYTQAASAFESQLMPIMSGAAVSPSEAQRQIRSALPELGDTPATLASKARTRMMMVNGAAKAKGLPLPFPNVPTWGVNTTQTPSSNPTPPRQGAGPVRVNSPQEAMKLPPGTVFITPDGRRKVR